jgi:phosphatidylserine/phosphatidylglycerophosphate/cardiolipin synthase-like enzyme
MSQAQLVSEIYDLVNDLPVELVEKLVNTLQRTTLADPTQMRREVMRVVAHPAVQQRVSHFLDFWQTHLPKVQPQSMALALQAVCFAGEEHRRAQHLELVWTGPDSQVIPLRRTDQALLQLINDATQELHIVSFAVYKPQAITQALVEAAQRDVSIAIYLETPDASEGKITFDTIKSLGGDIAQHARIYIWPLEQRTQSESGHHGSLHAKVAVADGQTMLISSANLTEYAMTLNMEMGLLVRGGPLSGQVQQHLSRLVEKGVFELV